MTELPFLPAAPDPTRPEREPRRSHRHLWGGAYTEDVYQPDYRGYVTLPDGRSVAVGLGHTLTVPRPTPGVFVCSRCGAVRDEARSRRGRTSLRAGKDAERAVAKAYPGGLRTGHLGGPDDVRVGDLFIIQSKAGGWFSERVWTELAKLPRTGGRIPTLVVSDRPGPGRRTRRYVVRMLEDDVALHGEETP